MSALDDALAEVEAVAAEAAVEIASLRRWKAEATEVIAGWELVWEAAGQPGFLGATKSQSVRAYIATLIADTLTAQDRGDAWRAKFNADTDTINSLTAQVERQQAVIDAAVNWVLACDSGVLGAERSTLDALDAAVRSCAPPDEVNEAEKSQGTRGESDIQVPTTHATVELAQPMTQAERIARGPITFPAHPPARSGYVDTEGDYS